MSSVPSRSPPPREPLRESWNRTPITRRALFVAYTNRWVRGRHEPGLAHTPSHSGSLSPVRRQLLGAASEPRSFWGLGDDRVPLRDHLRTHGLLDPERPCHR